MKYEPYRSYADRFNVYALCTASESTFDNGGSTFFDVIVDKYNREHNNKAHIPNRTELCLDHTFF